MRTRITKFLVVWCLLAIFAAGWRWKGGGHYLPVSVRVTAAATPDVRVWLISPFGTTRELAADDHDQRIFVPEDYQGGPVEAIAVSGLNREDIFNLKIICGESTPGANNVYDTINQWMPEREIAIPFDGSYCLFKPNKLHSRLPGIPVRCLNWGGDLAFLLFCLSLGLLITVLIHTACNCFQRDTLSAVDKRSIPHVSQFEWCAGALRILTVIVLSLQLLNVADQLANCRNATEGVPLILAATLVPIVAPAVVRFSRNVQLQKVAGGLTVGGILLLRWLFAGRRPFFQTGDYGTYQSIALKMLNGEWSAINEGFYNNRLQAERVLGWNLFNVWVSEHLSISPLLLNQVLFLTTMVFLFYAVSRFIGTGAAIMAAGLWSIYPDVFFGGHLLRHDNPAILMLLLYLYFLTVYFKGNSTAQQTSPTVINGWSTSWRILLFLGVLGGCIELQRSYLPFLLCCTLISLLSEVFLLRQPGLRFFNLIKLRTVCLPVISFAIALLIVWCGRYFLQARCGTFTTLSYADVISCWDYDSGVSWQDATPWLDSYTLNTSQEQKTELLLRKQCDAKLGRPAALLDQLLLKNSTLAGVRSAIRMSGGREAGEMFPSVFNVPYAAGKFAFAHAIVCLLLILAISRALAAHQPLGAFERVMFLFSVSFILPILLLTEAAEQYDLVLSVPLAVNAAVQFASLKRQQISSSTANVVRPNRASSVWLGGLAIWVSVIVVWYCASKVVQASPDLTFAEAEVVSVSDNSRLNAGRHAYCLETRSGVLADNEEMVAEFKVPAASLSTDRLRFFVSLDQRRKRIFWKFPIWTASKIRYSVTVDGEEVSTGLIGELRYAAFVNCSVNRRAGDVPIVLRIWSTQHTASGEGAFGGVAIEYLH